MSKIIDKINRAKHNEDGEVAYSFEFFPPKTELGVENLHLRMERMATMEPVFMDITWGAGGSTADATLDIATTAQKYHGVDIMMHLTCSSMTKEGAKNVLLRARESGIRNILALRGDPVKGAEEWEMTDAALVHGIDLVRMIKEEHGDYFGIAVAGHPEGHPDSKSHEEELMHLKQKVDAGADFIITQFFYDTDKFAAYVQDCREAGIQCPIVPGIMPINSYSAFTRMTKCCGTSVPPFVIDSLEPIRNDDEAVKNFGVKLGIEMCERLTSMGFKWLHFYTLNLERSVRLILNGVGYASKATLRRQFPWRASTDIRRAREDVRPINWSNCPKSYLQRTDVWDEFPNGRWGDGRSPAFGDLSDSHFVGFALGSKADRRAMWGEALLSVEDVYEIFVHYVEGKIPKLPWCESSLQPESCRIRDYLTAFNMTGFLTINSQPSANGFPSDHPIFGWGGSGGVVYQKSYVEFFASPENVERAITACNGRPELGYFAVNSNGDVKSRGLTGTTALTWGVFPCREVQQPTIFDPDTFLVWRKEAFSMWLTFWAFLYDEESPSYKTLNDIHDSFYLVAIVCNDFILDPLWPVLIGMLDKSK